MKSAALFITLNDVDPGNPFGWLELSSAGYVVPLRRLAVNPVRRVLNPFRISITVTSALPAARESAVRNPPPPSSETAASVSTKVCLPAGNIF